MNDNCRAAKVSVALLPIVSLNWAQYQATRHVSEGLHILFGFLYRQICIHLELAQQHKLATNDKKLTIALLVAAKDTSSPASPCTSKQTCSDISDALIHCSQHACTLIMIHMLDTQTCCMCISVDSCNQQLQDEFELGSANPSFEASQDYASNFEVLFASAGLNDFGLSASGIKAYALNRHLKTLAGIIFDLPAKQGLNLVLHQRYLVLYRSTLFSVWPCDQT